MNNKDRVLPRSVLLVEPERLFREGLREFLLHSGVSSLIEGETVAEALDTVEKIHENMETPEVSMVAIAGGNPEMFDDIAGLARRLPGTRLLLLLRQPQVEEVRRALDIGAHGCASAGISMNSLLLYLEMMALGERVLSADLVKLLVASESVRSIPGARALPGFSKREVDILECLAYGMRNREIGMKLGIRESTVKFHLSSVLRKIGASSRIQAVLWARQRVNTSVPAYVS